MASPHNDETDCYILIFNLCAVKVRRRSILDSSVALMTILEDVNVWEICYGPVRVPVQNIMLNDENSIKRHRNKSQDPLDGIRQQSIPVV